MDYLVMDRASEAAANDLAEVRKLIEGMNALVNSQYQQQQQLLQQQQPHQSEYPLAPQDAATLMATIAAVSQQNNHSVEACTPIPSNSSFELSHPSPEITATNASPDLKETTATSTPTIDPKDTNINPSEQVESEAHSITPSPQAGAIIEVTHLTYNRALYFQLTQDATIEPMIAWLRLSFGDGAISGMVLQYKGFDGLWKCLLNRDDSLRRILKQSVTRNAILQMRVPREQDLLSSGYTDRRLLALTKSESLQL